MATKNKCQNLWRSNKVFVLVISELLYIQFVIDWDLWQPELSRTLWDLKNCNFKVGPEVSIYYLKVFCEARSGAIQQEESKM